jgi:hypothetical protein
LFAAALLRQRGKTCAHLACYLHHGLIMRKLDAPARPPACRRCSTICCPARSSIVSAGMIASELKISPYAAQNLVAKLRLREATGRRRYRAWGIL